MQCGKCGETLTNCTCPDKEERCAGILKIKHVCSRMCSACGKHYAVCSCTNPVWTTTMGDGPLRGTEWDPRRPH